MHLHLSLGGLNASIHFAERLVNYELAVILLEVFNLVPSFLFLLLLLTLLCESERRSQFTRRVVAQTLVHQYLPSLLKPSTFIL